jgi:tripartite-type tricarboxylate transporter receptor subunit TctC
MKTSVMRRTLLTAPALFLTLALMGAMAAPLGAQTYPSKPVRFILPFPPGGPTDILGRIIGQKLADRLGQPFVPENRPGSGGNIGIELATQAKPDGYTIVLTTSTLAISPSLYKKMNYDPVKDLAPISLVAEIPNVLCVRSGLPVTNLKELIAYAKTNPSKINYGTGGVGTSVHFANEIFKSLTKIDTVHVPYKGTTLAMLGLVAGEVDMIVIAVPQALPHLQAGKARALAVLSNKRVPTIPDVPTTREAGVDNFELTTWYGILAPAGTPRDIIARLNAEWVKVAAMPDTRDKIHKAGLEPQSSTPEHFSEFLKAEIVRYGKIAKEANLSVE